MIAYQMATEIVNYLIECDRMGKNPVITQILMFNSKYTIRNFNLKKKTLLGQVDLIEIQNERTAFGRSQEPLPRNSKTQLVDNRIFELLIPVGLALEGSSSSDDSEEREKFVQEQIWSLGIVKCHDLRTLLDLLYGKQLDRDVDHPHFDWRESGHWDQIMEYLDQVNTFVDQHYEIITELAAEIWGNMKVSEDQITAIIKKYQKELEIEPIYAF